MGACGSQQVHYEMTDQAKDVEAMLAAAQEAAAFQFKILLLGAGESGKSTFVKQVKMIYKGGIPDSERAVYTKSLRKNAIECMQTFVNAAATLGLTHDDETISEAAERTLAMDPSAALLSYEAANDISLLWSSSFIQDAWKRRSEFWHLDASKYYFVNIDRLAEEDYTASEEDMLMARILTTGIQITEFQEHKYQYQVVDVGGQRSERRKWIHCFDNVNAILFLVGLSGYNQVLFEDGATNRMHESLNLFEEVTKNPLFTKTPIFLILNKKDLFEEVIRETDLSVCFPEYEGGCDARVALEHIEKKFGEVIQRTCPGKEFATHIISSRVRMDMKIAFSDIKTTIQDFYNKDKKKKSKRR